MPWPNGVRSNDSRTTHSKRVCKTSLGDRNMLEPVGGGLVVHD